MILNYRSQIPETEYFRSKFLQILLFSNALYSKVQVIFIGYREKTELAPKNLKKKSG